MRVAKVVGKVTLNKALAALEGGRLLLCLPYDRAALLGEAATKNEAIVLYDELGAREETLVGLVEGREATQPFLPKQVPIDAYNGAILDEVVLQVGGQAKRQTRRTRGA